TADKSGEAGNEGAQFSVGALSLRIARGPRRRRFVTTRAWMRGRRRGVIRRFITHIIIWAWLFS
ncbi:MAG TPA: hypothetical protein VH187_04860, partial [Scandinavium sp.]|uniref:hypothetical protein n=1 Tax=Scandinavium sp. TaxID=2830653 RepID=UPI002E34E63D